MNRSKEYEEEKLRLEVKELQRPWILRHFPGVVTVAVAMATIFLGFYTGLFDAQRATLELQKEELRRDIHEFTLAKDSVQLRMRELIAVNDSLVGMAAAFRSEVDKQRRLALAKSLEVAKLQASLQPAAQRAAYYEKAVKDAQSKYAETKSKYINELSSQFSTEYELRQSLEHAQGLISELRRDTARLGYAARTLLSSSLIPKSKAFDLRMEYNKTIGNYLNAEIERYEKGTVRYRRAVDSLHWLSDSLERRWRLEGVDR